MNIVQALAAVKRYTVSAPVNVDALASDLGLPVQYTVLPDDVSGAILTDESAENGYSVLINASHPPVRRRFTLAHEIGHFIYHRDLLGRGTGDTRAYRAEPATGFPNAHITPREERQANNFAANLLMPFSVIDQYRLRRTSSPRELASVFEVSEDAMRIRLGLSRRDA